TRRQSPRVRNEPNRRGDPRRGVVPAAPPRARRPRPRDQPEPWDNPAWSLGYFAARHASGTDDETNPTKSSRRGPRWDSPRRTRRARFAGRSAQGPAVQSEPSRDSG